MHLRIVICSVGTVTLKAWTPPGILPAAIALPFLRGWLAPACVPAPETSLPASQSGDEIFCWSCAGRIPDRRKDSGQYSPAQKRDRRPRLPPAHGVSLGPLASGENANRPPASRSGVPAIPAFLLKVFRRGPGSQASRSRHGPPWS